jgi:ATP-dependent RNA helicase DHX57
MKKKEKTKEKQPQIEEQKPSNRQLLFGNWTGKLPQSLLNEHCQREKWEKPKYFVNQTPKVFKCCVQLGKKNKKTGEIDTIDYRVNQYFDSAQMAKHVMNTNTVDRNLCFAPY